MRVHSIRWVWLLCLSLLSVWPAWAHDAAPSSAVDIEVFVRAGCPHCAQAETFLAQWQAEQPALRMSIRDVSLDENALHRLEQLAAATGNAARVPAFYLRGQLIVGYTDAISSGQWLREVWRGASPTAPPTSDASSCELADSLSCEMAAPAPPAAPVFAVDWFGRRLSLDEVGLPLFTLAMGLLDGFNPCSMWVLILMISVLAPLGDRKRMLVIAGTFVVVEGIAYFLFMAAWLNLFLFIGLSRASEILIATIALLAGAINVKDFWAFGRGLSLSIPQSAKPGIYARMRGILQAPSLTAAVIGAVVLAVLVQLVELLCTSGFPALYTRILTLHQLHGWSYYAYLGLYNLAYMFDDVLVLSVGVITLSQRRLQEREGRWLKLLSGITMIGLGVYLVWPAH